MEIKGIDVSSHQARSSGKKKGVTKINYFNLKSNGYSFVMLRAGYGRFLAQKDISFESNYSAAKAAGISVGAYHYSYAQSVNESKQEAACFLKWIEGKKLDYPAAFDIEDKSLKTLSTEKRTDIALAWLETVENAGYYSMLYCNADWAKNCLDMERLKHFDVWLACYTSEQRRKKLYSRPILGIWQYTSSLIIPGVYLGRLDGDTAYKDYGGIIKANGLNGTGK